MSNRFGCSPALLLPLLAFAGGFINGLIGTGGGILLLFLLRTHRPGSVRFLPETGADREAGKDACAAVLLCVLPLSVLSAALYAKNGMYASLSLRDSLPYLLGAVPGGMAGARLLDRLAPAAVDALFAALVLFAGVRMVTGNGG